MSWVYSQLWILNVKQGNLTCNDRYFSVSPQNAYHFLGFPILSEARSNESFPYQTRRSDKGQAVYLRSKFMNMTRRLRQSIGFCSPISDMISDGIPLVHFLFCKISFCLGTFLLLYLSSCSFSVKIFCLLCGIHRLFRDIFPSLSYSSCIFYYFPPFFSSCLACFVFWCPCVVLRVYQRQRGRYCHEYCHNKVLYSLSLHGTCPSSRSFPSSY